MSNSKLTNSSESQPLVTFALFAYNQEKYIREAVDSILAQTYSPMQIILSDDCSLDRTFEIMQEIASKYQGNDKIIVRQNTANQRLEDHINTVVTLAEGNWVVVAAGDDISEPDRVSEIMKVVKQYPSVTSVSSDLKVIDSSGIFIHKEQDTNTDDNIKISLFSIDDVITDNAILSHGATAAYSKKLFTDFAPLPRDSVFEDLILSFRSVLIGKRAYIHKNLVRYRSHENQITNIRTGQASQADKKRYRIFYGSYITTLQYRNDYHHIFSKNNNHKIKKWIKEIIIYNSLRYKAIAWIWPFGVFPYILSRFQNKKEVSLSLDTKARIFLPLLFYYLLKNMQQNNHNVH
jgi:glycosyltransferase involved in cell wall biosynthesis